MRSLHIETRIKLEKFKPRDYQERILDAWMNKGYKKILYVLPRRAGKDFLAFYMAMVQCITKVCSVYYALPTYSQAKKCIWDAISIDGVRFLDMIPKELIAKINQQDLKITFTNGSILRFIGADSYNTSLVGGNPMMIILSEAALMQLEQIYAYARPILAANGGTIIVLSTPRGKNAFWWLYQTALKLPEWYVLKLGSDETKHIDEEVLLQEKETMSPQLYMQEYFSSFDVGVDGQIYGREIEKMNLEERVGYFPHQPQLQTHLSIDIGVRDATTILWFQIPNEGNGPIFIIDSYSNTGLGLDHYAKIILDKPYIYGKMFAPHDISVRAWSDSAITRYERAHQMGLPFQILPQVDIQDAIDNVRINFPRFHINESKCVTFLKALEGYRRTYDEEKQVYSPKPLHSWESNYCDALKYLCQSIEKTKKGMSGEDFSRLRAEALYGNKGMPGIFKHNPRYDKSNF